MLRYGYPMSIISIFPGIVSSIIIMNFRFAEVESDVMDNSEEIDNRLLKNKKEDTPIVYLGSQFNLIR